MNIVVLQDYLRSGGTERQSVLLADAFAGKGHACTLLSFRPGGQISRILSRANLKSLQPFDTKLDWFAPAMIRRLRRLKPKVILCMGRMANCYAGYIKAQMPDCIVIATLRTGKKLPWLFRRSLHQVDHIVANSEEACARLMKTQGVAAERITVINNALVFKPGLQADAGKDVRGEHGACKRTFIMLCVAMFRPEKNQRELIEIAAGLPHDFDYQLWFAGDGPCLAKCQDLAAERGIANHVCFLGWLPDPSLVYSVADIAVHASHSEALSNFLIEAQSYGLPAVVYDAQGNSECMIMGRTGVIIPPGDRVEFRKAIMTLAGETPEERQHRSMQARSFAHKTFHHNRQLVAYLNLFRTLGAR